MNDDTQTVESDPYAHLFRFAASERAELSSRENIALLARLKATDLVRYEEFVAKMKQNKVPRLPELEREVNDVLKQAKKKKAARETQSDGSDGFRAQARLRRDTAIAG